MTDIRFATVVDDAESLLKVVDVDVVGDIETLLMFLFIRPVRVHEIWNDESEDVVLEVVFPDAGGAIETLYGFPLSMVDLARGCAGTVSELGPFVHEGLSGSGAPPDVSAMSDDDLIAALQGALGQVRLFNMLDVDD